jgi:hypothetical protein
MKRWPTSRGEGICVPRGTGSHGKLFGGLHLFIVGEELVQELCVLWAILRMEDNMLDVCMIVIDDEVQQRWKTMC